jgi:MFS family permease
LSSAPKVYTRQFWLLCLSSVLFFASFNMIIPELPSYLTGLGGAEYKGLIISLFTLTAMISRPFSGKIADKVGRIPVMVIGTSVCLIVSLLYPILSSVSGFLVLRLVHGFSTGFTPTGLTAYLADIIPTHKRGEAMGILGTAGTVGMSAGLAIGPSIANDFSLNAMFYCSSGMAVVSLAVLLGIKETLSDKTKFSIEVFKIHKRDLLEPRVLITCVVMLLTCYAYGTVFTVIPDLCTHVGIHNKGLPFIFLTVASLSVRLIAGKASDRFGRRSVVLVSSALGAISMAVIGLSSEPRDVLIGISLYGLAQGMTSPTLFAWATDLSDTRFKGRGISSLYIFMEMGIGVGAFASGFIYGNDTSNFFIAFMTAGCMAGFAFLYLVFTKYTGRPRLVKAEVVPDIGQIP